MPNIIASGDWWQLEDDGAFYVYCVGDMPYDSWPPWLGELDEIQRVIIQNGVTNIGKNAFANCENLVSAVIPNSVTDIEEGAFSNCLSLAAFAMPIGVTEIGELAFSGCESLTSVTIPGSVTTIGESAFSYCGLTDAVISDGVTTIGDLAFCDNYSLASVTIPASVTNIGNESFYACSALTDVYYTGTRAQWEAMEIYDEQLNAATIHYNSPPPVTLTSIAITTQPTKTAYIAGESFNPSGMVITATYSDASTEAATGCSVYPATALTVSDTAVMVIYTEGGVSATANVNITVTAAPPPPEPPLTEGLYIGGDISGAIAAFSLEQCPDVSYAQSVSLDGNELRSDELYITVRVRQNPDDFPASLSGVNRSTPVWYDRTDKDGNRRIEKYYWKSMERVSRYDYAITAQSPIGRLTTDFPGGLYNGQPLPDIIADVIGGIVPFSVDSFLQSVRVYGWLPYTSRREALHALALASGFLIRRDNACNLFFTLPTSSSSNLPDSVIFNGGSVDYRTGQTYARVDVTAYAFLQSDNEPVTLFDNTADAAPADGLTVKFANAPCYNIAASDGLTIHSYGVNHAVVSGVGVLTGRPYAVTSSILSLDGDPDADPNAVLSLSDVYLITDINAETVAQKLLSSYNAPAVVSMDFIRRAESPGDLFAFVDPYGVPRTGYLAELSGKVTSFDRVSAQFLCGYVPAWGNTYTDVLTLSGSGYWIVPAFLDGSIVRAVLIGGGQGGASGQHGTDATATGGGRGLPGKGGKILIVKLSVTAGQTFGYQCGAPGAGGVPTDATSDEMPENMTVYITPTGEHYHLNPSCNGGSYSPVTLKEARERGYTPCSTCVQSDAPYYLTNPGADGGNTTFGDYSSADGKIIAQGYNDIIHGVQYAVSGPDNGVEGGAATSGTENGNPDNPGWNDVQRRAVSPTWDASKSWLSGSPGAGQHIHEVFPAGTLDEWAYGGLGGGAAVGADGPDGDDAPLVIRGGNGGDGADASAIFPPDSRSYGSGGSGGHGGGEGAVGGSAHSVASYPEGESPTVDGQRGAGGSGSSGEDGAPGCVLIYFLKLRRSED